MYKAKNDTELMDAVVKTRELGRIPVFMKTLTCKMTKQELGTKLISMFALDKEVSEINLRHLASEGTNFPKKQDLK